MWTLQLCEASAVLLPYISGRGRRECSFEVPDENLGPPTRLCQASACIAIRVGGTAPRSHPCPVTVCTLPCRSPAPAPRPGSAGAAGAHAHAQWHRREPCLRLRRRLPVPQSLPAAVSLWLQSDRLLTVNLQQRSGRAAAASAPSGRGATHRRAGVAGRRRPAGSGECGGARVRAASSVCACQPRPPAATGGGPRAGSRSRSRSRLGDWVLPAGIRAGPECVCARPAQEWLRRGRCCRGAALSSKSQAWVARASFPSQPSSGM